MNRKHFKAILVLAGLMLLNLIAAAQGASEKFSNFVNADESDFTGVYVILGRQPCHLSCSKSLQQGGRKRAQAQYPSSSPQAPPSPPGDQKDPLRPCAFCLCSFSAG
jgi:hypothetical protein